jgi:hypothetical protein
VKLPTNRLDDWDLLQRAADTALQHAAENGWNEPTVSVEVTDEGGSYKTDSVADARSSAQASRHAVVLVGFTVSEALPGATENWRRVRGYFWDPSSQQTLTVYGPKESEVIGLAGLLREVLDPEALQRQRRVEVVNALRERRAERRFDTDQPAEAAPDGGDAVRNKRGSSWWSRWWWVVLLPLIIGVVGSLIASAIWLLF